MPEHHFSSQGLQTPARMTQERRGARVFWQRNVGAEKQGHIVSTLPEGIGAVWLYFLWILICVSSWLYCVLTQVWRRERRGSQQWPFASLRHEAALLMQNPHQDIHSWEDLGLLYPGLWRNTQLAFSLSPLFYSKSIIALFIKDQSHHVLMESMVFDQVSTMPGPKAQHLRDSDPHLRSCCLFQKH